MADTRDAPPTPQTCPGQRHRTPDIPKLRHPRQHQNAACKAPNSSPAHSDSRGHGEAAHQGPRVPPCSHSRTEGAATPYLHSVTLQQQLPLRRPRRSVRSSVLDFLRLKYSVSFPNEAMAPASSQRTPACSRGHRHAPACYVPTRGPARSIRCGTRKRALQVQR